MTDQVKKFGTAPVFFTAISTILGAILFLRFGMAVGTLGFGGVLLIILLGHMVTLPTALAISEIATNQKVEGGGEYFIISRSFGLNIGATIGISLFFSQAISVAFYIIAFTETFEPFFNLINENRTVPIPRQLISIPVMLGLSVLILKKGANLGVKALYVIVGILFVSIFLFFIGKTEFLESGAYRLNNEWFRNKKEFFIVFAICFPAFTGMTAGVGLSGDLKNPKKSIPLGTISATILGAIIYTAIAWKLNVSANPDDLIDHQLILSKIALYGGIFVPLGLAASTISSALGSVMVAPRTLQALASDHSFPSKRLNRFLQKENQQNEPYNATIITCLIALTFVVIGGVDFVAQIISMFFMVTYGSLCLISFLYHFSADPSYRPSFRSKWYISLVGFVLCLWLMFKISEIHYTIASLLIIVLIYIVISYSHKSRQGLQSIFEGAFFQLSRRIQVYLQKTKRAVGKQKWRPSIVCLSEVSFERIKAFQLMQWICYKHGFGTYIHLMKDYFSRTNQIKAEDLKYKIINQNDRYTSNIYIDTLISPSYTSAVSQIVQLPGISGMENNMILFEFDKSNPENLEVITDNFAIARAANIDVCILGSTSEKINFKEGIHIWITNRDFENTNLMILLSYIIQGHPDWKKSQMTIFNICRVNEVTEVQKHMRDLIHVGRLPVTEKNIQTVTIEGSVTIKDIINEKSAKAALTIIGFRAEHIKHLGKEIFLGYENVNDILFVNSFEEKELN